MFSRDIKVSMLVSLSNPKGLKLDSNAKVFFFSLTSLFLCPTHSQYDQMSQSVVDHQLC